MKTTSRSTSTRVDWGKIFAAVLLLLVVGYIYGRPVLERWVGHPLPVLGESGDADGKPSGAASDRPVDGPVRAVPPADRGESGERESARDGQGAVPEPNSASRPLPDSNPGTRSNGSAGDRSPGQSTRGIRDSGFFERLPGQRYRSPAGLVYGRGPGGEHRIEHILAHAVDDPSRPVHGVFRGDGATVFAVIDEAWKLARKGGRGVQVTSGSDGRTEYTVRLNRPVGYVGGSQGARDKFPSVSRIRIIVQDENQVVTAHPVK